MGHSNFLEPTLNRNLTVGHSNCYFQIIHVGDYFMLCYFGPVTSIQCVGLESLHEDLGDDPGSQTRVNSTLTGK